MSSLCWDLALGRYGRKAQASHGTQLVEAWRLALDLDGAVGPVELAARVVEMVAHGPARRARDEDSMGREEILDSECATRERGASVACAKRETGAGEKTRPPFAVVKIVLKGAFDLRAERVQRHGRVDDLEPFARIFGNDVAIAVGHFPRQDLDNDALLW